MKSKPNAIVLGGHNPHVPLVTNLKGRGYHTILSDYAENPPAKKWADEHVMVSSLDREAVLNLARVSNAKLVIAACSDQANATASYVAEKLGLPAPYSFDTATKVTNKQIMKQTMVANSIPTARYIVAKTVDDLDVNHLQFPLVIKPVDSYGSRGVRKVDDVFELEDSFVDALKISRIKQVVVEEFITGKEIQADYFVQNGVPRFLMLRQKLKSATIDGTVLNSYGSLIPANISLQAKRQVHDISEKISVAFGLKNTHLFIQAIVTGDEVKVVEFAPRIGGGLSYRLIELITGVNVIDATINSFLGIKNDFQVTSATDTYATIMLYGRAGHFGYIKGHNDLLSQKVIEEFYEFKEKGAIVSPDMVSNDRLAGFVVKGGEEAEVNRKISKAIEHLEVYDLNGEPMLNKSIYAKGIVSD